MNYVLDATVIVNLTNVDFLISACSSLVNPIVIPPKVREECNNFGYTETKVILDNAITLNLIQEIPKAEIQAAPFLWVSSYNLGSGEAECIAYCLTNLGSTFFCDDRKARRIGGSLLGEERVSGTIGILSQLTEAQLLQPDEAYSLYLDMVRSGGFLPRLCNNYFETIIP